MFKKGDRVRVEGRLGVVESMATYCVTNKHQRPGEVAAYYVLWFRKDGSVGKRGKWCEPSQVKGETLDHS